MSDWIGKEDTIFKNKYTHQKTLFFLWLAKKSTLFSTCVLFFRYIYFRFDWKKKILFSKTKTHTQRKNIFCMACEKKNEISFLIAYTGLRSAVGNVSGYRGLSDCWYRGREFDPGPVPYFRGDWSWNYFYGHSPPFRWIIQEGLLSVTSSFKHAQEKSVVRWTDHPAMTIAVDWDVKQQNKQKLAYHFFRYIYFRFDWKRRYDLYGFVTVIIYVM